MPDWSIMFIPAQNPTPNKKADFELDDPHGKRGANVEVFQGDIVSWNNTTKDPHQPAVFDPVGGAGPPVGPAKPVGDILQQHKSSPGFAIAAQPGSVIRFCCTQQAERPRNAARDGPENAGACPEHTFESVPTADAVIVWVARRRPQ